MGAIFSAASSIAPTHSPQPGASLDQDIDRYQYSRRLELFPFYSSELARLLVNERLQEARRARILHEGEQNTPKAPRRSVLDLFRRQVPAGCAC